jgi:hypothetical protein
LELESLGADHLGNAPEELGSTVGENARLKAVHYSRVTDGLAIASDGGLHIPALGDGWDPVRTDRFAGEGTSEAEKARSLLALMVGLRGEERRAFFVEAVAVAYRGEVVGEWEGKGEEARVVESMPERLVAGFWADALLAGQVGMGVRRDPGDLRAVPATDGSVAPSSAWARLRPMVQRRLREWLAEHQ